MTMSIYSRQDHVCISHITNESAERKSYNFMMINIAEKVPCDLIDCISRLITYGAKLLNADWLRQRTFFLNHQGTFGNQEGMITWCWLAKHACVKLVSRFKRIFKNFRNASLLSLLWTRFIHHNVKKSRHVAKPSLLVEKQKDFSIQKCIDSQPETKFESGRLVSQEA